MAGFRRVDDLNIENAKLIFRNFSGVPDKINPKGGRRKFGIIIDPAMVETLRAEGWNIKELPPNGMHEETLYYLIVNVRFGGYREPNIFTIVDGKYTTRDEFGNPMPLKEEMVSKMDTAELLNVNLVISAHNYDVNGKTGISAYLKDGYFEIQENRFARMYE